MDLSTVAEWLAWALAGVFAICGLYQRLFAAAADRAGTTSTLINEITIAAWPLIVPDFNELHFFWLIPLNYLWEIPAGLLKSWQNWAVLVNLLLLVWLS